MSFKLVKIVVISLKVFKQYATVSDIALIIFWLCLVLYRTWKQWCRVGVLDLAERTPLLR